MEELAKKDCTEGTADMERLSDKALDSLRDRVSSSGWRVENRERLKKTFSFDDFATALDFVNRVGALAEAQRHHPDIQLRWGEVVLEIWTHTVGGLTESDFIFAAKTEQL